MTQQTRTVEEIVLPLAERMVQIPGIMADGSKPMVVEFPMLREECRVLWTIRERGADSKHYGSICAFCQGRGYELVTTTDALLAAGKLWQLGVRWIGDKYMADGEVSRGRYFYIQRTAASPDMALALALEAARKGAQDAS